MIIRNFGLYLNAGVSVAPVIHTNQYDRGEQWAFTLYQEDGSLYIPETGAIVGIKADGNVILNSAAINASGQVVVNETEQMTAVAGDATFELSIDDGSHGTANFVVRVERKPTEGGTMSQSDISYLQDIADQVEADKVVVVEAEETVLDAESRISSIVPGNTGADGDLLTKSGSGATWSGAIPAKVGNLEGSVATIEASTALASHAIGEYVIVNGILYEVTAAISAGESIVPGTNVTATSVGAEINELNSKLTNLTVVLTTYRDFTLPTNARTLLNPTLPTVPTGYRAVLLAAQMAVNTKEIIFQGVANNSVMLYSTFSTALSGNDFPLYCTWLVILQ